MGRKCKICVVGDKAVGKTSLIEQFVYKQFDDEYIETIGVNVKRKDIILDNNQLTLAIWDTLGEQLELGDINDIVVNGKLKGTQGVMLVVDSTRPETAKDISNWTNHIFDNIYNKNDEKKIVPIIVLNNKIDLEGRIKVSENDLEVEKLKILGYNKDLEIECYATSAKTGLNVEEAFISLAKKVDKYARNPKKMIYNRLTESVKKEPSDRIKCIAEILEEYKSTPGKLGLDKETLNHQLKDNITFSNPLTEEIKNLNKTLYEIWLGLHRNERVADSKRRNGSSYIRKLK